MVIRILFLSANPSDAQQLQVLRECNDIDEKLRTAAYRDQFDLIQRHAITVDKLVEVLLRFEPQIMHFSGHGTNNSALVFQNAEGKAKVVPPSALTELFRIVNKNKNIQCVFLNACYSEFQAEAISKYVDCVIGMSEAITDTAARDFAAYFYQALGFGQSVQDAFDLGVVQLKLFNISDEHIPKLTYQPGLDPSQMFVIRNKNRNEMKNDNAIKDEISQHSPTESYTNFYNWQEWLPSALRNKSS
jgi:hypothetical protein